MAVAKSVVTNLQANEQLNAQLLEKVIIGNDLSSLNPLEKVQYVKGICQTLGLNPLTKPIQLMKFQGREIPYFSKDATEQLRKINRVSISNIDTKMLEGGVYVVTAYATTPDGRQDSSTGVISIAGLKGDALSNAMMKAETKSKRRVTLSICGLGFIDECEVNSIPNAKKIEIEAVDESSLEKHYEEFLHEIEHSTNLSQLKDSFEAFKKIDFSMRPDLFKVLMQAKDLKKEALMQEEFISELNEDTGEFVELDVSQ